MGRGLRLGAGGRRCGAGNPAAAPRLRCRGAGVVSPPLGPAGVWGLRSWALAAVLPLLVGSESDTRCPERLMLVLEPFLLRAS